MFFLCFSLFVLQSCNNNFSKSDELKNELKKLNIELHSKIKYVFILTDNDCYSCNKKFSILLKEKLNDENSIIIVNSKGLVYNISEFENKKNVVKINSLDSFYQKTKIMYIENMEMSSELVIDVHNIDDLKI